MTSSLWHFEFIARSEQVVSVLDALAPLGVMELKQRPIETDAATMGTVVGVARKLNGHSRSTHKRGTKKPGQLGGHMQVVLEALDKIKEATGRDLYRFSRKAGVAAQNTSVVTRKLVARGLVKFNKSTNTYSKV